MNRKQLFDCLDETETMALRAYPYIPERSKYKAWAKQLIAREIDAWKFVKLRNRLVKFHAQ